MVLVRYIEGKTKHAKFSTRQTAGRFTHPCRKNTLSVWRRFLPQYDCRILTPPLPPPLVSCRRIPVAAALNGMKTMVDASTPIQTGPTMQLSGPSFSRGPVPLRTASHAMTAPACSCVPTKTSSQDCLPSRNETRSHVSSSFVLNTIDYRVLRDSLAGAHEVYPSDSVLPTSTCDRIQTSFVLTSLFR